MSADEIWKYTFFLFFPGKIRKNTISLSFAEFVQRKITVWEAYETWHFEYMTSYFSLRISQKWIATSDSASAQLKVLFKTF